MPESNDSPGRVRQASLPTAVAVPLAAILILVFILLLFPWDALGRRVAWEISRVSGAGVEVPELAPALTPRGPVLRARGVTIEHPAVDVVRLFELEIAPRFSTSWFRGEPTLRVWAQSGLGHVDGVLRLGDSSAYIGQVSEVELERLPLRLEATGVRFRGKIQAQADVGLDPAGTLQGRVDFESASLEIESTRLPIPIPFEQSTGTIEILESGDTRVTDVVLEGQVVNARIDGEIGLVHRSQSPPIDLNVQLEIVDPTLRQLAPSAGLVLSSQGKAQIQVGGTLDLPVVQPAVARARGPQ